MNKKEYTARCHCGEVRFWFLSEEITESDVAAVELTTGFII